MSLTLTKLSETASKITLGWTPVPGAVGYRYIFSDGGKIPHTWDPNFQRVASLPACNNTFDKARLPVRVEALGVEAAGQYPPATSPVALPAVITQGGTYSGTRTGTVQVRTSEPVVLVDSEIRNSGSAPLLDLFQPGAQVVLRRTRLIGAEGSNGKAIHGSGVRSVLVENCDIEWTWGIRLDAIQAGGSLVLLRNKSRNQQPNPNDYAHFFQTANNGGTAFSVEVAWNEYVGEYGRSGAEDIVSIHSTHGATVKIHDNYLEGSYPWRPASPSGGHSGSAVMIEDASRVEVYDNICVATTNCGIGIASGGNNTVRNNRCVSSGKLPDGTQLAAANVGIYANQGSGGNRVFGNEVGWRRYDGNRNDYWLPLSGDWYDDNSSLPNPIERAQELAERDRWAQKVAAAGITIGA